MATKPYFSCWSGRCLARRSSSIAPCGSRIRSARGISMDCAAGSGSSVAASSDAKFADAIRKAKYGQSIVIEPAGKHLVSVVWLHGLGDTGHGWSSTLKTLPLKNIRWIVPTAPTRPVTINHGFPCTAWFDVGSLSDEGPDDIDGLDTSAAFVSSLLSKEPADVKLVVGGFSMGGATSLYTAAHSVIGKYTDGTPFTRKIDAAIAFSGWLPAGKLLPKQVADVPDCGKRAAELPIFMGHGKNDYIVFHNFGEMSARALKSNGFTSVTFKSYSGLDHSATPQELDDLCEWIKTEVIKVPS